MQGILHWSFDRTLEMMSDALTNAEKHVKSNSACPHSQLNTKDSVFWFAQMTLCDMTISNFPYFVEPNVISGGPTNRQFQNCQSWSFITVHGQF